jgi:hypothetical protein
MKTTFRILIGLNGLLLLLAVFHIGINEQYMEGAKLLYAAVTGMILFLGIYSVFPLKSSIDLVAFWSSGLVYAMAIIGLFIPTLLKLCWTFLAALTLLTFSHFLFKQVTKSLTVFKYEKLGVYGIAVLTTLPILIGVETNLVYTILFIFLSLLSVWVLWSLFLRKA